MTTWWTVLRRSVALSATPAFVLVVVTHLLLRPRHWVHEWYWTVDAYNFVTILLAPLVAGIATWDGARWAATAEAAASTGATTRLLRDAIGPAGVWSSGVFLAGLAAACAATASTTPGLPRVAELFAAAPAIALLWIVSAVGAVVGWLTRRSLAGPVVAIGVFAVLFAGYTVLPQNLLRIGGATGTLIALAPRSDVQALQVALYLSTVVAAVLLARHLSVPVDGRRWASFAACATAASCGFALVATGGMRFADAAARVRCADSGPEICLAPGYEELRDDIAAAVAPSLAAFAAAGFEPPRRLTQDVHDRSAGTIVIGGTAPTLTDMHNLLVFAIVPPDCDVLRDEATYRGYIDVWYWVGTLLDIDVGYMPDVDPAIAAGDSSRSRAVVRAIERDLRTCHSPS